MRKLLALVLFLTLSVEASAAPPYYPTAKNNLKTAKHTRQIRVDNTGRDADFRTLGDALRYVADQTRDSTHQWTITVNAGGDPVAGKFGHFVETSLLCPTYTLVQGQARRHANGLTFAGNPILELTGTSGVLFSLDKGCQVQDLEIMMFGANTTLTGNTTLLGKGVTTGASNNTATLTNLTVSTVNVAGSFKLNLIEAVTGSINLYDVSTSCQGSTANARNVLQSDTNAANATNIYGGRHSACTGQGALMESGSLAAAPLRVWWARLDTRATFDLLRSGSGALEAHHTEYATSSGVITDTSIRASSVTYSQGPKDLVGAGAPEGAVTAPVGSTYRRTDGGTGTSFCVKESGTGNTGWVCK